MAKNNFIKSWLITSTLVAIVCGNTQAFANGDPIPEAPGLEFGGPPGNTGGAGFAPPPPASGPGASAKGKPAGGWAKITGTSKTSMASVIKSKNAPIKKDVEKERSDANDALQKAVKLRKVEAEKKAALVQQEADRVSKMNEVELKAYQTAKNNERLAKIAEQDKRNKELSDKRKEAAKKNKDEPKPVVEKLRFNNTMNLTQISQIAKPIFVTQMLKLPAPSEEAQNKILANIKEVQEQLSDALNDYQLKNPHYTDEMKQSYIDLVTGAIEPTNNVPAPKKINVSFADAPDLSDTVAYAVNSKVINKLDLREKFDKTTILSAEMLELQVQADEQGYRLIKNPTSIELTTPKGDRAIIDLVAGAKITPFRAIIDLNNNMIMPHSEAIIGGAINLDGFKKEILDNDYFNIVLKDGRKITNEGHLIIPGSLKLKDGTEISNEQFDALDDETKQNVVKVLKAIQYINGAIWEPIKGDTTINSAFAGKITYYPNSVIAVSANDLIENKLKVSKLAKPKSGLNFNDIIKRSLATHTESDDGAAGGEKFLTPKEILAQAKAKEKEFLDKAKTEAEAEAAKSKKIRKTWAQLQAEAKAAAALKETADKAAAEAAKDEAFVENLFDETPATATSSPEVTKIEVETIKPTAPEGAETKEAATKDAAKDEAFIESLFDEVATSAEAKTKDAAKDEAFVEGLFDEETSTADASRTEVKVESADSSTTTSTSTVTAVESSSIPVSSATSAETTSSTALATANVSDETKRIEAAEASRIELVQIEAIRAQAAKVEEIRLEELKKAEIARKEEIKATAIEAVDDKAENLKAAVAQLQNEAINLDGADLSPGAELLREVIEGGDDIDSLTETQNAKASNNVTAAISQVLARNINNRLATISTAAAAGDSISSKGLWLSAIAGLNKSTGVNSYKGKLYGGSIGFDLGFNDDKTILGIAYSNIKNNIDVKNRSNNKLKAQSHIFTLYGNSLFSNNLIAQGLISGSFGNVDNQKTIKRRAGNQIAKGQYDTNSFSTLATLGYGAKINDSLMLTPKVGLNYINYHNSAYVEKNINNAKKHYTKARSNSELLFITGLEAAGHIKAGNVIFKPTIYAEVETNLHNKTQNVKTKFVWHDKYFESNSNNSYKSAKYSYNTGAGLALINHGFEVSTNYNFNKKGKETGHQGSVKLKVKF